MKRIILKIKNLVSNKSGLIVLIPFNNYIPHCGVTIIKNILNEYFMTFKNVLFVKEYSKNINELILYQLPKRIFLFAHSNDDFNALLVNEKDNQKLIFNDWWKRSDSKTYDLLVAYVCCGSEVLKAINWKSRFPRWISFQGDINFYNGPSRSKDFLKKAHINIINHSFSSKNVISTKLRIDSEYSNIMAEIYESMNDSQGDAITLMHFQQAKNYLISSEDYE